MKKNMTEFQKIKRMHARMNPKNSPAMKGCKNSKVRKEVAK